MSPVVSRRSRPPLLGVPRRRAAGLITTVIAATTVMVSILVLPAPLGTHELTVVNPHPWAAFVEVRPGDDGGWIPVGPVSREHTRSFEEAPVGSTLAFRFSYHGVSVEQVIGRDDLEAADHRVEVPEAFGEALAAAAAAPTSPAG